MGVIDTIERFTGQFLAWVLIAVIVVQLISLYIYNIGFKSGVALQFLLIGGSIMGIFLAFTEFGAGRTNPFIRQRFTFAFLFFGIAIVVSWFILPRIFPQVFSITMPDFSLQPFAIVPLR